MDSLPFFSAIIAVAWLIIWFVRQDRKPSDEQIDGVFAMRRPRNKSFAPVRPRGSPGQRKDSALSRDGDASATTHGRSPREGISRTRSTTVGRPR